MVTKTPKKKGKRTKAKGRDSENKSNVVAQELRKTEATKDIDAVLEETRRAKERAIRRAAKSKAKQDIQTKLAAKESSTDSTQSKLDILRARDAEQLANAQKVRFF